MNPKTKEAMFALNDELNAFCDIHPTVTVKRSDLQTVVNHLFNAGDEWSNQSALGYVIASAEWAGFSPDDIDTLVKEMKRQFDERMLESAARHYQDSQY